MTSKIKTRGIKQTINFKVSPDEIYEAFMDSKKHSKFTGSNAKISNKVGGKFSVYDGGLNGTNIQLIKNKKIVQSWRCVMENWPEGHYSKATFSLKKTKQGTQLIFTQTSVPVECYDSIKQGWRDYYWKPMKQMLA